MSDDEDGELGGPYNFLKSQLPLFDGITSGNVHFALGLFKHLCQEDQEKNVVVSPFIVTHAMLTGLLYGTSGSTAEQIKEVLHVPEVSEEMHSAIRDMLVWVYFRQVREADVANGYPRPFSFFYDKNGLVPTKYYQANKHMNSMRFLWTTGDPEENRRHLNYRKIQRDYDVDIPEFATKEDINDETVFAVMTSHNYCNVRPFTYSEELKPEPKSFYLDDDTEVEIPMVQRVGTYGYAELDDPPVRVIQIEYPRHECFLFVVLPKEKTGLADLVESLNADSMKNIIDSVKEKKVDVTLPRFKFVQSHSLIDALKSVGLTEIFSKETADFGKMCADGSEGGYLTAFRHHAIFEIDAEGQGKPWDDPEEEEEEAKPTENGAGDTAEKETKEVQQEETTVEAQEQGGTEEAQDEGETTEAQEEEKVEEAEEEAKVKEEENAEEAQEQGGTDEAQEGGETTKEVQEEGEKTEVQEEGEKTEVQEEGKTTEEVQEEGETTEAQEEEKAEAPEEGKAEAQEAGKAEAQEEGKAEEAQEEEKVEEAQEEENAEEAQEEENAEEAQEEEKAETQEEEKVKEAQEEENEEVAQEEGDTEFQDAEESQQEADTETKEEEVHEEVGNETQLAEELEIPEEETETGTKEEEAEGEPQEEAETETKEEEAEAETMKEGEESAKGVDDVLRETEIFFGAANPFMFFLTESQLDDELEISEEETETGTKKEEAEGEPQEEAETETKEEEAEAETETMKEGEESAKGDDDVSEETEIFFVADHPFMFFVKEKPSQFIHMIGRFHHLPEEDQLS